MESRVLKSVRLGATHGAQGATSHFRNGQALPRPSELRIVQLAGADGYNLLHIDSAGKELTDTYHESLEDALGQAQFEFGVSPAEWNSQEISQPENS